MKLSTDNQSEEVFGKIRHWAKLHPYLTLTLIVFALLSLFLPKPFNIDDPLFIWSAHQIQAHPLDPFGFNVNWYGVIQPMWSVTDNPPFACYYMALAAKLFGWGEIGLHFAFILPALAATLGIYRLAKILCGSPMMAAIVTLTSPVFLVSSTTLMCDVMMLAFWIWAVVFWLDGMEKNCLTKLFWSAVLVTFAMMTKYFGLCLVPLLAAHGILYKRGPKFWFLPLLFPLVAMGIYQALTTLAYGHGLITRAAADATRFKAEMGFSEASRGFIGLAFAGGCVGMTVFFAPWIWSRRFFSWFVVLAVLYGLFLFLTKQIFYHYQSLAESARVSVKLQLVFWALGGVSLLALAVMDFYYRRDAASVLLFLWVIGTFIFAAFVNWTTNARSILPLTPAVAILMFRKLGQNQGLSCGLQNGVVVSMVLSGLLGVAVARADFLLAVAVRDSAWLTSQKYGNQPNILGFQGHWGFQYYMEQSGATAMNFTDLNLKRGTYIVAPENNVNLRDPTPEIARPLETINAPGPKLLTTVNTTTGAGFYASLLGPLPFVFCKVPPEEVRVFTLLLDYTQPPND